MNYPEDIYSFGPPDMTPERRALIEQARAEVLAERARQEWEAGEREVDEDIAAGRVYTFATPAEAVAWLLSDDEDE